MSEIQYFSSLYTEVIEEFGWAAKVKERRPAFHVSASLFVYLSVLSEIFAISGLAAFFLLFRASATGYSISNDYVIVTGLLTSVTIFLFKQNRLYKIEYISDFKSAIWLCFKIWGAVFVTIAVLAFCIKFTDQLPKNLILIWYLSVLLLVTSARFILASLFRICVDRGVVAHRVVIVGSPESAMPFIKKLYKNRFGIRIEAIFDDTSSEGFHGNVEGIPHNGGIWSLLRYSKTHPIDTVVIISPGADTERLRSLVRHLSLQPLMVRILPTFIGVAQRGKWCAGFGELPGIHLMTIADLPIEGWGRFCKRLMDFICGTFALVVLSPLMLACVVGIKISSPGSVLYRQKRIGYRNREFFIYKFRSMHLAACDMGYLTQRNDKRIFRFGALMRKLSLDELPQLLNVLKGEMSLVGPRPHMSEARAAGRLYFDLVSDYAARHRVKPGITGWAQVNGWRGPTETTEQIKARVEHDLYYIENWSLTLDLVILVKTACVGFFGRNAF
jgi:Undecaprenyl-phosphate glucose phosphotransferase